MRLSDYEQHKMDEAYVAVAAGEVAKVCLSLFTFLLDQIEMELKA